MQTDSIKKVNKMNKRTKNIFDYSHVKSVTAWALVDNTTKAPCGRIIANWSDNPNGSVCTAQVFINNAEERGLIKKTYRSDNDFLKDIDLDVPAIGKAGGGGYCKLSAAIKSAFYTGFENKSPDFGGAGVEAVKTYLKSLNIEVIAIC
jgi:hypothetical protein